MYMYTAHPCSVVPAPGCSMPPHSVVECAVPPCSKPHTCVDPTVMNNTHAHSHKHSHTHTLHHWMGKLITYWGNLSMNITVKRFITTETCRDAMTCGRSVLSVRSPRHWSHLPTNCCGHNHCMGFIPPHKATWIIQPLRLTGYPKVEVLKPWDSQHQLVAMSLVTKCII